MIESLSFKGPSATIKVSRVSFLHPEPGRFVVCCVLTGVFVLDPSQRVRLHSSVQWRSNAHADLEFQSGGLPARMANGQGLKLIEPLRSLYKVCPPLNRPLPCRPHHQANDLTGRSARYVALRNQRRLWKPPTKHRDHRLMNMQRSDVLWGSGRSW